MFPQVSGVVDYYIKNPQFQQGAVVPAIKTANNILPSKFQIPEPTVLGSETSSSVESPLKSVTDEISQQVASIAAQQVVNIKKSAQEQVCQALLEKLKTECGQ
jgi:tRNA A37 threonylcarbamoyltransferase TsaD